MLKYIDNINNFDAVRFLLEILEVKSENQAIIDLKEEATKQLRKILSRVNNPDWLISLLLRVREDVRKEK